MLADIENSLSDTKYEEIETTCVELIDAIVKNEVGLAKE